MLHGAYGLLFMMAVEYFHTQNRANCTNTRKYLSDRSLLFIACRMMHGTTLKSYGLK